jgi:hypothetical protein
LSEWEFGRLESLLSNADNDLLQLRLMVQNHTRDDFPFDRARVRLREAERGLKAIEALLRREGRKKA